MGSLNRFRRGTALIALLALSALVGCSSQGPTTYPVSGKVLLDGQPLEGAAIMLKPVDGGSNAYGVGGADGSFDVTTYRQGDGAVPGKHQIIVTLEKIVQPDDLKTEPVAGQEEGFDDELELAVSNQAEVISLVPARYADFETSGLTVEVGPENLPLLLNLTEK